MAKIKFQIKLYIITIHYCNLHVVINFLYFLHIIPLLWSKFHCNLGICILRDSYGTLCNWFLAFVWIQYSCTQWRIFSRLCFCRGKKQKRGSKVIFWFQIFLLIQTALYGIPTVLIYDQMQTNDESLINPATDSFGESRKDVEDQRYQGSSVIWWRQKVLE